MSLLLYLFIDVFSLIYIHIYKIIFYVLYFNFDATKILMRYTFRKGMVILRDREILLRDREILLRDRGKVLLIDGE